MHLDFCSALDWRVAIAAKQMVPIAKPARVGPLGTSRTPLAQRRLFLQFGWGLHQFQKNWLLNK